MAGEDAVRAEGAQGADMTAGVAEAGAGSRAAEAGAPAGAGEPPTEEAHGDG